MALHRFIALGFAAASIVLLAQPGQAAAAVGKDSKSVPTQTITIPPDSNGDDGDADGPPAKAPAAPANETVPVVEYDMSKLPPPVQALRDKIIAAAKTGDIEQLKPIIAGNPEPPDFGADETAGADPIAYLKSLSGDPEGRELLAILITILEAGYVHVDVGTPQEAYIWPYFARYPVDKLTPPQMVELFRILTSSDFDQMKSFGAYMFYRVGITPKGEWAYFEAGD